MDQYFKTTLAIFAIVGMAACGGSSTGNNGSGAGGGTGGAFVFENKVAFEALQDITTFTFTPAADVPGTADYAGFVQISSLDNAVPAIVGTEAVGVANFSVDLSGAGTLTGSATDFQDRAGTYTGTLDITSGGIGPDTVSPSSTIATGEIGGTLTRETGEVIVIDGAVEGRFFGDGGAMLVGSTGDATGTVDGTSGDIEISIHGQLQ